MCKPEVHSIPSFPAERQVNESQGTGISKARFEPLGLPPGEVGYFQPRDKHLARPQPNSQSQGQETLPSPKATDSAGLSESFKATWCQGKSPAVLSMLTPTSKPLVNIYG